MRLHAHTHEHTYAHKIHTHTLDAPYSFSPEAGMRPQHTTHNTQTQHTTHNTYIHTYIHIHTHIHTYTYIHHAHLLTQQAQQTSTQHTHAHKKKPHMFGSTHSLATDTYRKIYLKRFMFLYKLLQCWSHREDMGPRFGHVRVDTDWSFGLLDMSAVLRLCRCCMWLFDFSYCVISFFFFCLTVSSEWIRMSSLWYNNFSHLFLFFLLIMAMNLLFLITNNNITTTNNNYYYHNWDDISGGFLCSFFAHKCIISLIVITFD